MVQQTEIDGKWPFGSPWLRQQVETHLFFGLVVRKLNLAWVVLGIGVLSVLYAFATSKLPIAALLASQFQIIVGTAVAAYWLFNVSRIPQAVVGWIVFKGALGVAALLMMTFGAFMSHVKGQSDEVPNLLLGAVWVPWPEFIPTVTPHQKYVTLARIILTIPLTIWGIRTGYWQL